MTGENAATAEMPGVEEIARVIYSAAIEDPSGHVFSRTNEGMTCVEVDGSIDLTDAARAILALFAPILVEKEREMEAALFASRHEADLCQQALEDRASAEARALAAEAAVLAVSPYIDSIVCYASTIDTHDGNRVAKLVNEAAAAIRAQITAPAAAMEAQDVRG